MKWGENTKKPEAKETNLRNRSEYAAMLNTWVCTYTA